MQGKLVRLLLLMWIALVYQHLAVSQTYTVIYRFSQPSLHGNHPNAGLIQDAAGNLYGTTNTGGPAKLGTVFKLDTSGNETVLHSFLGGSDGAHPIARLAMDGAGNLYGTTRYGGVANVGIVFKIDPSGTETILHSFEGGADGAQPFAGVFRDAAGNLYGTTCFGGVSGKGTTFKLDANGNQIFVHSFSGGVNGSSGASPIADLNQDASGILYSTTRLGGFREGTIYSTSLDGMSGSILFSFPFGSVADGQQPWAGVIPDNAGNLYGTTRKGGSSMMGTIFKFNLHGGGYSVLHSFGGADGAFPRGSLVRDASGNVYGTTAKGGGGTCNCGVVFKLDPSGVETVLHAFTGGSDGDQPLAGLVMDAMGNLFGTTSGGGISANGTIFKITLH